MYTWFRFARSVLLRSLQYVSEVSQLKSEGYGLVGRSSSSTSNISLFNRVDDLDLDGPVGCASCCGCRFFSILGEDNVRLSTGLSSPLGFRTIGTFGMKSIIFLLSTFSIQSPT